MLKHLLKAFYGIVFFVALDQLTKYFIQQTLEGASFLPIAPFFNLVFVKNRGISFGLFSAGSPLETFFLILLAAAILIFLIFWYTKTRDMPLAAFSLLLIIAGALGNLIDRVRLGSVIDFLDFHIYNWHFPAFNIADSLITLGAIGMVLTQWRESPTLSSLQKDKK